LKNGKNSLINDENLWLNGVNLGSDVVYPSSNGAYPKQIGENTVIDIRHRCNRTRFSKHLEFSIYEGIQCEQNVSICIYMQDACIYMHRVK
jgi:hypothetical protein